MSRSADGRPRVIVNADDFGLSSGVNRGIVLAHREGILTSTTMMVNMPSFDEAVALARDHPDLGVGIHLTLLWGTPVSDPSTVASLVDRSGRFPDSAGVLARRYATGRIRSAEVRAELRAQIRRFLDTGLRPTHLDSHKHVHCLPGVLRAVIDVATEHGISRIRYPDERRTRPRPGPPPPPVVRMKSAVLRFLCRRNRGILLASGLRTTDYFTGVEFSRSLGAEVLVRLLRGAAPGVTEIMCHPGEDDSGLPVGRRPGPRRAEELAGLIDSRVVREAESVELISFRGL